MRKLGKWGKLKQEGGIPAPIRNDDMYLLTRAWSSPSGFLRGAQFVFRTIGYMLVSKLVGMGASLASHLMWIGHTKLGVQVWLNSPIKEVVVEGGRAVGAVVEKDGKLVRVKARRGVMLAAGGFSHNVEWRKKYQGVHGWSASPMGQQGQGIEVGHKAGGALGMMDDAWWGTTVANADGGEQHGFVLNERSDPWSLVVDQTGVRYLNESESCRFWPPHTRA